MSLYVSGTCNMTNGSAAVVGVGTAFVANVAIGDGFIISGDAVYYTVASVTDDTHLALSANYAGATGTGKSYQVSRDWTINLGLAEVQPGDPNWPYLLTQKIIRLIDAVVAPLASPVFTLQISTPKIVTASGNLEITPEGNAHIVLQGSGTGKVGIGKTPIFPLDVAGSARFGSASANGNIFLAKTAGDVVTIQIASDDISYFNGGNVGIGVTPTTRNNSRLQIVDGIGFPATQSASSDPNTLDDYEEGTWTPVLTSSGGGTVNGTGEYVKIGKQVTLWGRIEGFAGATFSAGYWTIASIPFAHNSSANTLLGDCFELYNIVFDNTKKLAAHIGANLTYIDMWEDVSGSARLNFPADITGTSKYIGFTLTYKV